MAFKWPDRKINTKEYSALVEWDGTVLVYDRICGYYTRHHTLSAGQIRYVKARAR